MPDVPEVPEIDIPEDSLKPVADAGGGPTARLPFTGIEDMLLPLFVGMIALLGGVVAYRYAAVRDAVGRVIRAAQANRGVKTGYSGALQQLECDDGEAGYWDLRISA